MSHTLQNVVGSEPRLSAKDLRPGDEVGEYVISHKIGEGGMASVYGAIHPIIAKKAAIKVLAPELSCQAEQVERFIQEARAVNAIGHPNIVDVFAFGALPDGRCYFMMEWLQGCSLEDLLNLRPPSLDITFDILDQIAEALEAAHHKGIVHRDLKPANVFLVPAREGRFTAKLLDFGVAKLMAPLDGLPRATGCTGSGQVVGTPEYISPEQARGQPVDHRADLYSLGVVAYEMVLGRLPFDGASVIETMRMHISDLPPLPRTRWPQIPPSLEDLLLRLLAKSPAERPTLAELRALFAELRQPTTGTFEHRRAPHRVRAWMVALAVVATFALARAVHRLPAAPGKLDAAPASPLAVTVPTLAVTPRPPDVTPLDVAPPDVAPRPIAPRDFTPRAEVPPRRRVETKPRKPPSVAPRDHDYLVDPFAGQP